MSSENGPQIGDYGLLVSFMRVKIGREFETAGRLSKRLQGDPSFVSYYTCYGEYDLLELATFHSFDAMHRIPHDEDIIDHNFSLFYSWTNFSEPVHIWAKGFPVLVLVLLDIRPDLKKRDTFSIEFRALQNLKDEIGNDVNLFHGMGRSEILLILRGRDLGDLLHKVTHLRQTLTVKRVLESTRDSEIGCDLPIFIRSTSFPVIAHPVLKGETNYYSLEGQILPRVSIECYPGYEKLVAKYKPNSCSAAYNVYGRYDIEFSWNRPIDLSIFVSELTAFRKDICGMEGIVSTSTKFICESRTDGRRDEELRLPESGALDDNLTSFYAETIRKSSLLPPVEQAKLIEFIGRLGAHLSIRESHHSLRDMSQVHLLIIPILDQLEKNKINNDRRISFLSNIIDLANHGLCQRYTGVDIHFASSSHHPYPFLCGINGYIMAASTIPCYVFRARFPNKDIKEAWPGFVLFGVSYSYQYMPGQILSYQASSLNRPIEDWWGITHEVAHAIYNLTNFRNQLPLDIRSLFEDIAADPEGITFLLHQFSGSSL